MNTSLKYFEMLEFFIIKKIGHPRQSRYILKKLSVVVTTSFECWDLNTLKLPFICSGSIKRLQFS
jgi:hypothetical protein